ncbi:N-acetylglucosamine kinase [Clostridium sardiniense]|uniref:N-acetylglucosamine kinase n=1 Tax=Clostridium sardiniense TaxID=29369 RepID=UPI003D357AE9
MYYLGIDGGGTKTQFTLVNEKLEVIYSVKRGTSHFKQVGFNGVKEVLQDGLEEIINKSKIDKCDIAWIGIGLAGYGNIQKDREALLKVVDRVFKDFKYILRNDVEIALAGALNGEDGVVIVSGTGSIALSKIGDKYKRCGGWGYSIGDEGSAYWIGKKIIETFSKEADGRLEKTHIYEIIKEMLALSNDYDLIRYINEDIKSDRLEIARFSKVCFEAAKLGDKNAIEIFKSASKELSELVNLLIKDFEDDIIKVSYLGGVFKSGELILNPLIESLNKKCVLVTPRYTADIGAAILALKNDE